MKQLGTWLYVLSASLAFGMASCSWLPKSWHIAKAAPVEPATVYHEVNEHATVIPAKYGREYTLSGNMVARYQDFDLALVKIVTIPGDLATEKMPEGNHYFFEARNRDGFLLSSFTLPPNQKEERSTITISRYHYHFSAGRTPGSIIIYLPIDQMASCPAPSEPFILTNT